MKIYLFKPFGADNYLVLTEPDEIKELFGNVVAGDEMILRVLEFSQEEFDALGDFDGFAGPTGIGGEGEEEPEEEEPEEETEPEEEEPEETLPPKPKAKLTPPPAIE
jgi:hypothetical protein